MTDTDPQETPRHRLLNHQRLRKQTLQALQALKAAGDGLRFIPHQHGGAGKERKHPSESDKLHCFHHVKSTHSMGIMA